MTSVMALGSGGQERLEFGRDSWAVGTAFIGVLLAIRSRTASLGVHTGGIDGAAGRAARLPASRRPRWRRCAGRDRRRRVNGNGDLQAPALSRPTGPTWRTEIHPRLAKVKRG